ncbi:MAG: glycosyltransferase 61 family protein [Sphingobium sp.]|nr:glycosyltransferase family 61 protein [Sphingobium sp.]MCP5398982.1 glycosyltransferase family 61 protein [Sphingomonas sp.]
MSDDTARLYPPSRVFGTPFDEKSLDGVVSSTMAVCRPAHRIIEKACIVGNDTVLQPDSKTLYMTSSSPNLDTNAFVNSNHRGFASRFLDEAGEGEIIHASRSAKTSMFSDKSAAFFSNLEKGNYGSFLIRQLNQILRYQSLGISCSCYVVPERSAWIMETFRVLGMPELPIYSVAEVCGEEFASIVLLNEGSSEGLFHNDAVAQLRSLADVMNGGSDQRNGRKIYVSRRLSALSRPRYRVMQNEDAVEAIMARHGFDIIYPETMSFSQQVRAFSNASHVIGPSGSGMLNVIFGEGAKIVDIETVHSTVRQHAKLYSSANAEYAFLFEKPDPEDDVAPFLQRWSLSENLLREALDWLL